MMSDFMLWLYANYIRPQLETAPRDDYDFHFDLLANELPPCSRPSLDKCLEFTAAHAFLLDLRTGAGLSNAARQYAAPMETGRAGHGSTPCLLCLILFTPRSPAGRSCPGCR